VNESDVCDCLVSFKGFLKDANEKQAAAVMTANGRIAAVT